YFDAEGCPSRPRFPSSPPPSPPAGGVAPPPPPFPFSMISLMSCPVVVPGMLSLSFRYLLFRLLSRQLGRKVLRHKIQLRISVKFIGSAVDHRRRIPKISLRSRRSDTPFERCGSPGVVFFHPFTAQEAVKKIDDEKGLCGNGPNGR